MCKNKVKWIGLSLMCSVFISSAHADEFGYWGYSEPAPIISLTLDPHQSLNTSLRIAAREGRVLDMEKFLQQGADVDGRSDNGATALMLAARNCSPKVIDVLLRYKPIINLQDFEGRTALMYAAMGACVPVVKHLLKQPEIRVDIKDKAKRCALDYAVDGAVTDVGGAASEVVDLLARRTKVHRVAVPVRK